MHIAERLFGIHRDTVQETGDPARLPAQIAGRWDKGIEIEYDGEKYFVQCRLEQPRLNKNLLYRHDKLNEPIKEGSLSIVLFESPFTSVSTVSRGHPSLVSLTYKFSF